VAERMVRVDGREPLGCGLAGLPKAIGTVADGIPARWSVNGFSLTVLMTINVFCLILIT